MTQVMASTIAGESSQARDVRRAGFRYRLLRQILRMLFRVMFRVRVEGGEHVPGTPVIVCANHLGWADTLMVMLFLPGEPRIYVVGDKGVQGISRFRRLLVETFGVVQLDQAKPVEALRTMNSVVGQGGSLLVFPEGKLGVEEGKLLPLQKGAAHVSVQSGTAVLPVGLTGTSKLWIRRQLTVRIGVPVGPEAFETGSLHDRLAEITGRLGLEIQRLLPGDDDLPRLRLLERWLTKLF